MKTEVSKMTRLLIVTCERQLAGMLLHQFLESFQAHNLPERSVNRFGTGFNPEHPRGLVRQTNIQPHRCHRRRHVPDLLALCIYSLTDLYTHVKPSVRLARFCLPRRTCSRCGLAPGRSWLAGGELGEEE